MRSDFFRTQPKVLIVAELLSQEGDAGLLLWQKLAPWNRSLQWRRPKMVRPEPGQRVHEVLGTLTFVYIPGTDVLPGGVLRMGSPNGEGERWEHPQHDVRLSPCWMSTTPVTQAQWAAVAADAGLHPDPSEFKGDDRPVERVSWHDAVRWCNALSAREGRRQAYAFHGDEVTLDAEADGYRLPTEAEWEHACRAGTTTRWWCGEDEGELAKVAWFGEGHRGQTHPVASKGGEPTHPWNLHDMHGNVWEWCWDWFAHGYEPDLQVNPTGPSSGDWRVLRGGSFGSSAGRCRSAYRSGDWPGNRDGYWGFRVALSPPLDHRPFPY